MLKRMACFLCTGLSILILLTGCWDKVEIDQRCFVASICIDPAPPGYAEKVAESVKGVPGTEVQKGTFIKVTYVIPNTSLLASEEGGGGNEPGSIAISSIATDIPKASSYIDARMSRRLFFGHTQLAVFSEDILKDSEKMREIIDYFRRSPYYNRTMKLLAAEGEAAKAAELKPKGEKLGFKYIQGILQNEATNGRIISVDLNEFVTRLTHPEGVAVLPKITIKKDEVKISGMVLIKGYRLAGHLSEYDTLYFNTLIGNRPGGMETINVGNLSVDFATNNSSSRMKLLNADPENLEVQIEVRIEGTLFSGKVGEDLFDCDFLKEIEQGLNKMAEESCRFVINKLQKEFNADAMKIADYLKKYHPDTWDAVKDKWDEVYPDIKIVPKMDYKIRRIGTVK